MFFIRPELLEAPVPGASEGRAAKRIAVVDDSSHLFAGRAGSKTDSVAPALPLPA